MAVDGEEALKFSTSSRRILPLGPEPLIWPRGTPRSKAIFFAIGEAKIRSPVGSSLLDGEDEGVGSAFGAGGASSLGGDGADSALGDAEDAFLAKASAVERSSPSSAMTAMIEPTWTFFAPSWAYWTCQRRMRISMNATHQNLSNNTVVLGFNVNGSLVGFL